MARLDGKRWAMGAAAVLAVASQAPSAQAQDFFSNFFGGFGRPRVPAVQVPYDDGFQQAQPRPRYGSGGGQAYCVRTCDGRYFPISSSDRACPSRYLRRIASSVSTTASSISCRILATCSFSGAGTGPSTYFLPSVSSS